MTMPVSDPFRIFPPAFVRIPAGLPVLALFALCLAALPARAHELRPAIATIGFDAPGRLTLELSVNLEALVAEIGVGHEDTSQSKNAAEYDRLRALAPAELRSEMARFAPRLTDGIRIMLDGRRAHLELDDAAIPGIGDTGLARISMIRLGAEIAPGAEQMEWRYDPAFGDSVVRLRKAGTDEIVYSVYLGAGVSESVALTGIRPPGALEVFTDYLVIGFRHIVPGGLDHILFVVGLFLLSPRLRPLLWQVTSFTLAHSVTLALGMLGLVQLPPAIIEPLIAASIVYVAVENMMTDRLQRWRPAVVFGFGLLHGLGFAGVLTEVGLSPAHFASGLIGFNLGVELGQLAVITGCFLAVGIWFRSKGWYRRRISVPASAAIAMVGLYWFIVRVI